MSALGALCNSVRFFQKILSEICMHFKRLLQNPCLTTHWKTDQTITYMQVVRKKREEKMVAEKWQCSFSHTTEWVKGSVIGSGSYCTVQLAINNTTGALFVAKSAKSEARIKSLENEANILEKLNYPHIVKCIGKDVTFAKNGEMKYSFFFEYMAGGSLSDVAQKFGGALNEKVIRLEILWGLKYLHENGIVHLDVKCKNVLLGASGAVKLADFGCARTLSDDQKVNINKNSCNGLDFQSKCLERDSRKRWMSEKLPDHPFVMGKIVECGSSINEEFWVIE